MEHKREMRLMLSRTGVLVVGVTSVARARARERERERESPCVSPSLCQCIVSTCLPVYPQRPTCLRKALDIPFYRYKEMPSCTMGCSLCANVAGEEVP
jgi:hypothetical protein